MSSSMSITKVHTWKTGSDTPGKCVRPGCPRPVSNLREALCNQHYRRALRDRRECQCIASLASGRDPPSLDWSEEHVMPPPAPLRTGAVCMLCTHAVYCLALCVRHYHRYRRALKKQTHPAQADRERAAFYSLRRLTAHAPWSDKDEDSATSTATDSHSSFWSATTSDAESCTTEALIKR